MGERERVHADGSARPLLLSFDFEDWHQLVHRRLGMHDWDTRRPALQRQTRVIFDLLDELGAKATFFVLGLSAKNYPHLVTELAARGNEVACHGYAHERVYEQTPGEFRRDVERSVEVIESITGVRPVGYRAPAFSINRDPPWAYEVLADLGFRYDSSQYASPRVPRAMRQIPHHPYRLELPSGRDLWEFPITPWRLGRQSLPIGGGAYWRILPSSLLVRLLRRLDTHQVLYFHPYECDPVRLQSVLPDSPSKKQRLWSFAKSLERNAGRKRVVPRIRRTARDFRFLTYEEAHADVVQRYGACTKALSREGVLV
jgi:polysaccharide deacetylase family protein (PEP-CTERM system associated)